jgi:subtilisin family serine protease
MTQTARCYTGSELWHYDAGKPIRTAAAVAGDGTIFFAAQGSLYALDGGGSFLASFDSRREITTSPAISPNGSVAYFGDRNGNLYAFDLEARAGWLLLENSNGGQAIEHTPTISADGSTIYIVIKKMIAAIVADSGEATWTFEAAAMIGGAPALDRAGNLHFGDSQGNLYVLDSDGALPQSIQTDAAIKTAVVTTSGGDSFATVQDALYAISAANGEASFEFLPEGVIQTDPILGRNGTVVYVTDSQKNLYAIATGLAPDTAYPRVVGAPDVWTQGVKGDGVAVAVIDTGIAPLDGLAYDTDGNPRLVGWADFVDNSPVPIDPNGHGTLVANSETTEFGHYAGVAPDVELVGIRVLDETGSGTYAGAIAGIGWAIQNKDLYNIRVINLSLVAPVQSHYWDDPLNLAVMAAASDIVVVAAAGNEGPEPLTINVPGNVPYVITVGAFTDNFTPNDASDDYLAPFSSAGPTGDGFVKPDVIAPGAHMASLMAADSYLAQANPDNQVAGDYYQMAGTSVAAPVVAAISALVLDQNPALSPNQVKYRVMAGALLTAFDTDYDGSPDVLAASPWQQ